MSDATHGTSTSTRTLAQRITPGEWRAFGNLICANNSKHVIARTTVLASDEEEQANAQLIALAPSLLVQRDALLAALQAVVDRACALEEAKSTATDDALTCLEGRLETAIVKARAAIALAGGGTK